MSKGRGGRSLPLLTPWLRHCCINNKGQAKICTLSVFLFVCVLVCHRGERFIVTQITVYLCRCMYSTFTAARSKITCFQIGNTVPVKNNLKNKWMGAGKNLRIVGPTYNLGSNQVHDNHMLHYDIVRVSDMLVYMLRI